MSSACRRASCSCSQRLMLTHNTTTPKNTFLLLNLVKSTLDCFHFHYFFYSVVCYMSWHPHSYWCRCCWHCNRGCLVLVQLSLRPGLSPSVLRSASPQTLSSPFSFFGTVKVPSPCGPIVQLVPLMYNMYSPRGHLRYLLSMCSFYQYFVRPVLVNLSGRFIADLSLFFCKYKT